MWSLTSLRTKRISSFRKFRLLPPKDFFDSIGQSRHSDPASLTSGLPRSTDIIRPARLVRFVPKSDIDSITIRPLRWQGS